MVYEQRAWYGIVEYKTLASEEDEAAAWLSHSQRIGPFKRPRNAMVALEQEVTILKNRYGKKLLLNGQLWAEA